MLVKAVKAAGCSGGEAQISSGPAGHKEPASGGRIHDCIWTETFHGWFLLDIGGGSIHDQQYPGDFLIEAGASLRLCHARADAV